jgi:DNA mismatch endonuclease (patch repair protein)
MPDKFSKAVRSRIMASIKSQNTGLERVVFTVLRRQGVRFRKHYRGAPGTPDLAWPARKIAVFLDGDFWHGWRYPAWRGSLSKDFWREKIERNRARDRRNFATLRRHGWQVMRIWEHEIERDLDGSVKRIMKLLKT